MARMILALAPLDVRIPPFDDEADIVVTLVVDLGDVEVHEPIVLSQN